MFYKNTLRARKVKNRDFEFDFLSKSLNVEKDESSLKIGQPQMHYNFITEDGSLRSGYGFKDLAMPTSEDDLVTESTFPVRGDEVKTIWQLKWYDAANDENNYYLFYFNNENYICFNNLFGARPGAFVQQTNFTETPYTMYYRRNGSDTTLLSGEGANLAIFAATGLETSESATRIVSCCNHYGKLFAITATARGSLVYNSQDEDILTWTDDKTSGLDFGDERGDLNKVISFNDYLFLFRDFGITKISEYGTDSNFAVIHLYQSNDYIYPNSIAQDGDNIFFLEGNKLKKFNGSSVKDIEEDVLEILKGCDNRYCYGECFEGKYFLACNGKFDDEAVVGCEGFEGGYKNNLLIVYDIESGHIDITRGVDIKELLALKNKFKRKLVACFNNEYKGRIGELTEGGSVFDVKNSFCWESGKTDFGIVGKRKRIKHFFIKTQNEITVTIESDKKEKNFVVKAKDRVQKIKVNIVGNQFKVKITGNGGDKNNITNFVITVSQTV